MVRPRGCRVSARLEERVITAIDELGGFFGPSRSKTACFFLVNFMVTRSGLDCKPFSQLEAALVAKTTHVGCGTDTVRRVRFTVHEGLLVDMIAFAEQMQMDLSDVMSLILTLAVDEKIRQRHPCLRETLEHFKLERQKWPWET